MTINIAITGSSGRIGKLLIPLITSDHTLNLTASLTRKDIENNLIDLTMPPDVIIDFTRPEVILSILPFCIQNKIKLVIGTTGFKQEEKEAIVKAATKIPILLAPNMSLGINVSYQLLAVASKLLPQMDVGIFEIHNRHKLDAPSGTALQMAEVIKQSDRNSKSTREIQFSSLRIGEEVGDHTIKFALPGEQLEITHKALNPELFARGAIRAAKWLIDKPPQLYSMQDVLEI